MTAGFFLLTLGVVIGWLIGRAAPWHLHLQTLKESHFARIGVDDTARMNHRGQDLPVVVSRTGPSKLTIYIGEQS